MRLFLAFLLVAFTCHAAPACSPDALGTGRVISVGTQGGGTIGLKTYPQTLQLRPREVVLTFDDGPYPGTTNRILAALDAECVKATFFMVGQQAAAHPALARQVLAAGHTVGYHSMSHPNLRKFHDSAARANIEQGFFAVDKALYGSIGKEPRTPFFRFPYFADTQLLGEWLSKRNIVVFGTDLWASDWLKMTPDEELKLVLQRLEKSGGGIVLLHDIQPRTAEMLPRFLHELKLRHFTIAHVTPGPGPLATSPAPPGWTSATGSQMFHARRATVMVRRAPSYAAPKKQNGGAVSPRPPF